MYKLQGVEPRSTDEEKPASRMGIGVSPSAPPWSLRCSGHFDSLLTSLPEAGEAETRRWELVLDRLSVVSHGVDKRQVSTSAWRSARRLRLPSQ